MDRALCGGGSAWARRPEPCASTCPHMLSTSMTELLVPERIAHPFWDGRKLLTVLQTKHRRVRDWTAPSTVAHRLARCGLVQRRRVRRPTTHSGAIPAVADAPNVLRTADFKGQFRTGDHANCYLLTVADFASRYLLTCHGLRSTTCELAKPSFERTFAVGRKPTTGCKRSTSIQFCWPRWTNAITSFRSDPRV